MAIEQPPFHTRHSTIAPGIPRVMTSTAFSALKGTVDSGTIVHGVAVATARSSWDGLTAPKRGERPLGCTLRAMSNEQDAAAIRPWFNGPQPLCVTPRPSF